MDPDVDTGGPKTYGSYGPGSGSGSGSATLVREGGGGLLLVLAAHPDLWPPELYPSPSFFANSAEA
jgi:hypothetical protein